MRQWVRLWRRVGPVSACQLDPYGSGIHSSDVLRIPRVRWDNEAGKPEHRAIHVCGYHRTYWPELVARLEPEEVSS